jgi:hypothetical protein
MSTIVFSSLYMMTCNEKSCECNLETWRVPQWQAQNLAFKTTRSVISLYLLEHSYKDCSLGKDMWWYFFVNDLALVLLWTFSISKSSVVTKELWADFWVTGTITNKLPHSVKMWPLRWFNHIVCKLWLTIKFQLFLLSTHYGTIYFHFLVP